MSPRLPVYPPGIPGVPGSPLLPVYPDPELPVNPNVATVVLKNGPVMSTQRSPLASKIHS